MGNDIGVTGPGGGRSLEGITPPAVPQPVIEPQPVVQTEEAQAEPVAGAGAEGGTAIPVNIDAVSPEAVDATRQAVEAASTVTSETPAAPTVPSEATPQTTTEQMIDQGIHSGLEDAVMGPSKEEIDAAAAASGEELKERESEETPGLNEVGELESHTLNPDIVPGNPSENITPPTSGPMPISSTFVAPPPDKPLYDPLKPPLNGDVPGGEARVTPPGLPPTAAPQVAGPVEPPQPIGFDGQGENPVYPPTGASGQETPVESKPLTEGKLLIDMDYEELKQQWDQESQRFIEMNSKLRELWSSQGFRSETLIEEQLHEVRNHLLYYQLISELMSKKLREQSGKAEVEPGPNNSQG